MKNNPLLSIAIPTYNRAVYLKNLLECIVPQAAGLGGNVEICISDNNSTDNTAEVVAAFKKKHPGLINYNKNQKNLGFDKNILKTIEMSRGNFTWTFGDDDSIIENGPKEVIEFIKKVNAKNTGLIVTAVESYFIDKQTGQKIISGSTINKNKPETFTIDKKEIIGMHSRGSGFMSVLIFNNKFLTKIIKEDREIIKEATGIAYMHILLRSLMFLKYSHLEAIALNKPIVLNELPSYRAVVEDKFMLHYKAQKKMNNLLLSYKYIDSKYTLFIIETNKKLRRGFIIDMLGMRAFKNFNYVSYFGCLRLFFQWATFTDALLFSFVFSILFLIPPIILISLDKLLLMIRYGKGWKAQWFLINNFISITTSGNRRIEYKDF